MPRLLALLSLAVLCGCGAKEYRPGPAITRVAETELPKPLAGDTVVDGRAYVIGPFDELNVSVFGVAELSAKEVQVDAAGRFSFPLVGTLDAAGKTPREVADMIDQRLRGRYVRNPSTTVNLVKTVSQFVTVEGSVLRPGLYPAVGRMSLLRAIASAQGTSEFASRGDVVVMRTVGGKQYAALYSLNAIRNGLYPDPEIYANDVVMVGESRGRQLFRDFIAGVPLLTTPLILLLQK